LVDADSIAAAADAAASGKALTPEMKELLRAVTTGPNRMKPSEFFIKQLRFQGIDVLPEQMQQLQKLDETFRVSSAPAGARPQVAAWQNPFLGMARNLGNTAMNTLIPPAQAAGGPSDEQWMQDLGKLPGSRGTLPPPPPGGGTTVARSSVPVARGSKQQSVARAAKQLGIDPVHLAAVMSLETGGTFNPGIVGGQGGNYRGLIQFGPTERTTYGYRDGMRFEDQVLGPVVRYLKARGVKPGHGAKEIYAAILTGNVANIAQGGLDWKDSNGTSVRKALPSLTKGGHYQNAVRFLSGK